MCGGDGAVPGIKPKTSCIRNNLYNIVTCQPFYFEIVSFRVAPSIISRNHRPVPQEQLHLHLVLH